MCLRCEYYPLCVCCVLSTSNIFRIHSFPLGGESSVCEAAVGLEGDRYCVTGTDHQRGKDGATVCA